MSPQARRTLFISTETFVVSFIIHVGIASESMLTVHRPGCVTCQIKNWCTWILSSLWRQSSAVRVSISDAMAHLLPRPTSREENVVLRGTGSKPLQAEMTKQITNPSLPIIFRKFTKKSLPRWIQDEAAGYPARQGWAGPYVAWIFTTLQSDLTGLGRAQLPLAPSPSQIAAQQPVSCLNWCIEVVSSRIWIRII